MTEDTMNLRGLLEKTADTDFLREMIGFSAQRLMELEVESLTGAPHGARNPDRLTHRNGYRERDWVRLLRVGEAAAIAPVRDGRCADHGDPCSARSLARCLRCATRSCRACGQG